MSLDAVEEMLDAAISDNGESRMHACRHCVYNLYIHSSV
jgi:hypothetical protein